MKGVVWYMRVPDLKTTRRYLLEKVLDDKQTPKQIPTIQHLLG
jgi:hypothetical protein